MCTFVLNGCLHIILPDCQCHFGPIKNALNVLKRSGFQVQLLEYTFGVWRQTIAGKKCTTLITFLRICLRIMNTTRKMEVGFKKKVPSPTKYFGLEAKNLDSN